MALNADKCKMLLFGHGNKNCSHEMGGVLLESMDEERDLRLTVNGLKHNLNRYLQFSRTSYKLISFSFSLTTHPINFYLH